jgi:hypothetical protein
MTKPVKRVRRTVVAVFKNDKTPVATRALEWEEASRSGARRVHRVEHAGAGVDSSGAAWLIDLELECRGANRHDFTKFVRSYLPEADRYYITD